MLKLKLQYFGHLMQRTGSFAKKKGQKKSGLAKAGIIISIVVAVLAVLGAILGVVGYFVYIFVLAGASA